MTNFYKNSFYRKEKYFPQIPVTSYLFLKKIFKIYLWSIQERVPEFLRIPQLKLYIHVDDFLLQFQLIKKKESTFIKIRQNLNLDHEKRIISKDRVDFQKSQVNRFRRDVSQTCLENHLRLQKITKVRNTRSSHPSHSLSRYKWF